MSDLFDRPLTGSGPAGGFSRTHARLRATDALAALDYEMTVAAVIRLDALADQAILNAANLVRLQAYVNRIGAICDLCCPMEVRHAG